MAFLDFVFLSVPFGAWQGKIIAVTFLYSAKRERGDVTLYYSEISSSRPPFGSNHRRDQPSKWPKF